MLDLSWHCIVNHPLGQVELVGWALAGEEGGEGEGGRAYLKSKDPTTWRVGKKDRNPLKKPLRKKKEPLKKPLKNTGTP